MRAHTHMHKHADTHTRNCQSRVVCISLVSAGIVADLIGTCKAALIQQVQLCELSLNTFECTHALSARVHTANTHTDMHEHMRVTAQYLAWLALALAEQLVHE